MDVIPSEIFRGHLDTIILLSLVNEDKHTNQIRDEIEDRSDGKFELKQGTFYSCLQRIVKQGYVTEYRATSSDDGVRRKFYQLTEKGKNYIDDNKDKWELSRSVVNVLLETPEKKQEAPKKQPEPKEGKPVQVADLDIDKVLKEYLNSPDTAYVEPKKTKEEPLIDVSDDKVKIIDFGDIATAEPPKNEPLKGEQLTFDIPTAKDEKPSYDYQSTYLDTNRKPSVSPQLATTPETFDLINLVGLTKEELEVSKSSVTQKPAENEKIEVKETSQTTESAPLKQAVAEPVITVTSVPENRNHSQFPDPNSVQPPSFSPTVNEDEDDYFNGETAVTHDYKAVLQKIFPQTKKPQKTEERREFDYVKGTDIKTYFGDQVVEPSHVTQPKQQQLKQPEKAAKKQQPKYQPETKQEVSVAKPVDDYDFSDIRSLAKNEGFKVSFSSGTNKAKVNSILVNKLVAVSSLIFFLFALAEIVLLGYFTANAAGLSYTPFMIAAAVLALFPIVSLFIYFIDPKRKVGSIPTMKSVIELCIIIMLNLVLIMIVFAILAEVDFSDTAQLIKYILYPSIIILNIPIYFIIKYLNLENLRFYN